MSAKSTSPATDARAIADAAVAFLAALTPGQRAKVAFPFDSPERTNWHYVPRARKGLARRDMNEAQLEAADALLAATASGRAFHQIKAVFQREVTLKAIEQAKGTLIHERDPGLYYFSVFGDPSGAAPWGWRVDGHHVSVNIAVMD
ncbi:MAG: DUF3500 domain-containing protein, partial [SAR202 cluster bacterium]|nr:DUF3500 domain-containing protein [SAR202 cluster bacterium]